VSLNGTRFDATNVTHPDRPVGDSYSGKVVGDLSYAPRAGRWTLGYTARHQAPAKENIVGTNPIGDEIPAFTVHSARAGLRLPGRFGTTNHLSVTLENIGNTLYAEFPNAGFFRPEPGRNVRVALTTAF
jgi:hypothetical protein